MYGVQTRVLNQAVKRNKDRFPDDFMFQLTEKEMRNWISQSVMTNSKSMGVRRKSNVFTDYIDINEDTRMQIELINETLAELQKRNKGLNKSRIPIGYLAKNKSDIDPLTPPKHQKKLFSVTYMNTIIAN